MYRSAMTNEDKAAVLLFNNPIPDHNNLKGKEGPLRYHPSWIDEVCQSKGNLFVLA